MVRLFRLRWAVLALVMALPVDAMMTAERTSDAAIADEPLPDLLVDSVTWQPREPQSGDEVVFTVEVANVGLAPARNFTVVLFRPPFPPEALGEWLVDALDADAAVALRSPPMWARASPDGFGDRSFDVLAQADAGGQVNESREDDNGWNGTVTVHAAPVLAVGTATAVHGTVAASVTGRAVGYLALSATNESSGLWFAGSGTRSARSQLAAASGTGDATANELALSGTSNATSRDIAVSGTGRAEGPLAMSVLGTCNGHPCVAANPAGPADGEYLAVSGTGPATCHFVLCAAASGTGRADGRIVAASGSGDSNGSLALSGTGASRGGLAASATGDADGATPLSATGRCNGVRCFAVEPSGDADGFYLGVSPSGHARSGGPAASGLGDAESGRAGNVSLSVAGGSRGATAASVLGPASCAAAGCSVASVAGDASCTLPSGRSGFCLAVSGAGAASCHAGGALERCGAVSVAGPASAGCTALAGPYWCLAASGADSARARCPTGICFAASAAGPAEAACSDPVTAPCGAASLLGDARASCARPVCTAVSGAGDADACSAAGPWPCSGVAVAGLGDARGRVAVSGTGHADGSYLAVSGCDLAGACTP